MEALSPHTTGVVDSDVTAAARKHLDDALAHYATLVRPRVLVFTELSTLQRQRVERALGAEAPLCHVGIYEIPSVDAMQRLLYELRSLAVPHAAVAELRWEPHDIPPSKSRNGADHGQ